LSTELNGDLRLLGYEVHILTTSYYNGYKSLMYQIWFKTCKLLYFV